MMRASTRSTRGRSNATYSVSGSVSRPQVHHDPLPAIQAFQPLAAPAEGFQLARKAGLKVGLTLGGSRLLTPLLTVATGGSRGPRPSRGAGGPDSS